MGRRKYLQNNLAENLLYVAVNGIAAQLRVLFLTAFEKY